MCLRFSVTIDPSSNILLNFEDVDDIDIQTHTI
jgi:hypothetical protein